MRLPITTNSLCLWKTRQIWQVPDAERDHDVSNCRRRMMNNAHKLVHDLPRIRLNTWILWLTAKILQLQRCVSLRFFEHIQSQFYSDDPYFLCLDVYTTSMLRVSLMSDYSFALDRHSSLACLHFSNPISCIILHSINVAPPQATPTGGHTRPVQAHPMYAPTRHSEAADSTFATQAS